MFNPIYEKLLVKFFGVTDNIKEAGYMLRDGRLLDFSGRHFISDPIQRKCTATKMIEHHDLFGVNYQGFSIEELWPDLYEKHMLPVLSVMTLTGAVSLSYVEKKSELTLRTCHPFTEKQVERILHYFEEYSLYLSYVSPEGYIVDDSYVTFLTKEKLLHWVNTCHGKEPSPVLFSSAASKAPYTSVDSTPIRECTLSSFVGIEASTELRKRKYIYQEGCKHV